MQFQTHLHWRIIGTGIRTECGKKVGMDGSEKEALATVANWIEVVGEGEEMTGTDVQT